ncbi:MAG: hypothetical protein O3A55_06480 [Bacteroidetes bacterium]|nr:hypothetical protein [Bacteroidota bacterium]
MDKSKKKSENEPKNKIILFSAIGIIIIFFASFLQVVSFSTTNFGSFSELAFGFTLKTETIVSTIIFSLIMGFVGGFLPAIRASRLKIVNALRGL